MVYHAEYQNSQRYSVLVTSARARYSRKLDETVQPTFSSYEVIDWSILPQSIVAHVEKSTFPPTSIFPPRQNKIVPRCTTEQTIL